MDPTPEISETPQIISADDHVVEPPHLWEERLPAKYLSQGPTVARQNVGMGTLSGGDFNFRYDVTDGQPCDVWHFEDVRIPMIRNLASVGFDKEEMSLAPITYEEMRPGCYDPKARLDDMDINGVEASLCFPNHVVRFCGQTFSEAKDKSLGLACVQAYNDWMIEEWSGPSEERLIPLTIVPLWDAHLAAEEVRRNAIRGARAVCFSEAPYQLGYPSIHSGNWDEFFAACEDTGTVICMHIGSSSKMPTTSTDAPAGVAVALTFQNAAASLTDWLLSGKLLEFPRLQICFAECQIGWVPYMLERIDTSWETTRGYNEIYDRFAEPPSSQFSSSVYVTFFDDRHGVDSLGQIGRDRVLFETDYPHTDGTWPDSRQVLETLTAGLGQETTRQLARGNAIDMLGLNFAK